MKYVLLMLALLVFPLGVFARADLQILQSDIRFSKTTLIAGDLVRLYATVHNVGDEDVSGYVSFYQGAILVGSSQVISLLANGNPEEVYVDFVVPSGAFNIQAKIEGTEPADVASENDVTVSPLYEPVMDDDRDGIPNGSDNCSTVVNADQANTDADAQGDACDQDDDNDGVSDSVETETGTDATRADSDGDGADDRMDVYPKDANRQSLNQVPDQEPPVVKKQRQQVLQEIIARVAQDIQTEAEQESQAVPKISAIENATVAFSPRALFSYTRASWNTFQFVVLGVADESAVYVWNFGDGVTSSKFSPEHTYAAPGAYTVTLSNARSGEAPITQSAVVLVPFFTLSNPVVATALAVLALLLAAGFYVTFSMLKKRPSSRGGSVTVREE